MHENYLCMLVEKKGSEFHVKEFVKLLTVKLSIFSLIFAVLLLLKDACYGSIFTIRLGKFMHGVIFYLQLIGVKSIKQTYFHLHFTQHDAWCIQLLFAAIHECHRDWVEWIFIYFIFIAVIKIQQCYSRCIDLVSWTAWQVTLHTWISYIIFKKSKFLTT